MKPQLHRPPLPKFYVNKYDEINLIFPLANASGNEGESDEDVASSSPAFYVIIL
jgi:hypothetical protein